MLLIFLRIIKYVYRHRKHRYFSLLHCRHNRLLCFILLYSQAGVDICCSLCYNIHNTRYKQKRKWGWIRILNTSRAVRITHFLRRCRSNLNGLSCVGTWTWISVFYEICEENTKNNQLPKPTNRKFCSTKAQIVTERIISYWIILLRPWLYKTHIRASQFWNVWIYLWWTIHYAISQKMR